MVNKGSETAGEPRSQGGQVSIDELDQRLLVELMRDSRQSFREISKTMGVSATTVIARVENLRAAGILRGFSVLVDQEKLGYDITAITEIFVSKGKLLEMEREIAKLPNVCAVYDVTGEIDGIVIAKFKNREELSRFTKGVLSMPFVERANTQVVLTTVREDFRLPPLHDKTS
jgi:DNA-binding Lrp family transcriptional regulator